MWCDLTREKLIIRPIYITCIRICMARKEFIQSNNHALIFFLLCVRSRNGIEREKKNQYKNRLSIGICRSRNWMVLARFVFNWLIDDLLPVRSSYFVYLICTVCIHPKTWWYTNDGASTNREMGRNFNIYYLIN